MNERHLRSAEEYRRRIAEGAHDRFGFRAALLDVPFDQRDAWIDRVLGLGALPDDGAELPAGCVPYLPCAVDALIEAVDRADIGPDDVFVDVGSGVGRALAVVHLLSGAAAIGIEIQQPLVAAAREVTRAVSSRIEHVHGDAVGAVRAGTVYFLYCPFSGERLERMLDELAAVPRPIRVCCVDLPLPERAWLVEVAAAGGLSVYRSAE
jgi:SAM-dependent methyltransferase